MSKKTELKEETKEQTHRVNFDTKALSLIERQDTWCVVEVPFDSVSLKSGDAKVVYSTPYMVDAEEKLRILIATDIFI